MTSLRFPTCWDGKNLDSPDHMAHMSYPETGTVPSHKVLHDTDNNIGSFESAGPCPASHPVRTAQVMYEVVWDTRPFNDLEWPADGSNPFVWSNGDATGYANHADYVFGWKDDALDKILSYPCHFGTNCSEYGVKMQSIEKMNECTLARKTDEDIDGCKLDYTPTSFLVENY